LFDHEHSVLKGLYALIFNSFHFVLTESSLLALLYSKQTFSKGYYNASSSPELVFTNEDIRSIKPQEGEILEKLDIDKSGYGRIFMSFYDIFDNICLQN